MLAKLHSCTLAKLILHTKPESLIIFFHVLWAQCWRPQDLLHCQKRFSSQCPGEILDPHYPQFLPYNMLSGQQSNQVAVRLQEEMNWWNPIQVIINTQIIGQAASHSASQLFTFLLLALVSFLVESGAKSQLSSVSMLSVERRMCFLWPQFTC